MKDRVNADLDTAGGTYDVDPATADDKSLPEGMTRERKGPMSPTKGRG